MVVINVRLRIHGGNQQLVINALREGNHGGQCAACKGSHGGDQRAACESR